MKSKHQRAKDLLDKVFSIYIRTRDRKRFGGICPICNKRPIEVCFHFFPRGNTAIRWNEDNCCGSCCGDNFNEHMTRGQDKRDTKFRDVHIRLIGETRRIWLEQHKGDIIKYSAEDLLEMKREIERKLEHGV